MPTRSGTQRTRSQSRGRTHTRDQQTATLNAPKSKSMPRGKNSPQRARRNNTSGKNKPRTESVSKTLPSSPEDQTSQLVNNSTVPLINDVNDSDSHKLLIDNQQNMSLGASAQVSDNRSKPAVVDHPRLTSQNQSVQDGNNNTPPKDPYDSSPSDPWHLAFTELRAMRTTTETFSHQLQSVVDRTSSLESSVGSHSTRILSLEREVEKLKNTVQEQGKIISEVKSSQEFLSQDEIGPLKSKIHEQGKIISDVKSTQEGFSNKTTRIITEMNGLLEKQKGQVEDFKSTAHTIRSEAAKEAKKQVSDFSKNIGYNNSLKEQAFRNRFNLVFVGLEEQEAYSPQATISHFLKTKLQFPKIKIKEAQRLGNSPMEGSTYSRPLLVKFYRLEDRNKIWRKRNGALLKEGEQKVRIQADLPKRLREDVQLLYRVARAASKTQDYRAATVRNYALLLDDKEYQAQDLETLPLAIRPSTLAVTKSDTVLAFFSKHCKLSNHYPSSFTLEGKNFNNVEQFLAFKRAELSGDQSLVDKALNSPEPTDAKSILNLLRKDHEQQWQQQREGVALEGLRAKFNQNKRLQSFLIGTDGLTLGEASKNGVWGVGLTLEDQNILNIGKWLASGNLLGQLLMKIRQEILSRPHSAMN